MPPTGKKRVTINDIAQMTGTSKTTVSFYLNGKTDRMGEATRERIRAAIEETGYEPSPLARGMNSKRSNLMGVIIGDITNAFSNQIVKGITSVADEAGYRVLVSSSNFSKEDELAYIDRLIAVGVDGFIVQPTAQFKKIMTSIEDASKQLVFIDSKFYDHSSSWIKTDNYEASYQAVQECIERGYERFLLVTAAPGLLSSRIERYSGFVDALSEKKIGFEQFDIADDGVDIPALQEFLRRNIDGSAPTLVFAPNCWALPDIYIAMREFYPLMPATVGLLGFDNTEWAGVANPAPAIIVQPALEEGRQAARLLIDLIEGGNEVERHQVLSCSTQWGPVAP